MNDKSFVLYLVFVISWFIHLPSRIPFLGIIRFDFTLVLLLIILALLQPTDTKETTSSPIDKYLKIIIIYAIATVPFVEWPGSVLKHGLVQFTKACVFYFFTVKFVRTEKQLKIFMIVFLAVQSFRILEPLYLHVTTGYWGSVASMANWQLLDRLSGAPHDIVNPNGLAFIIATVIPFYYYYSKINKKILFIAILLCPLFIWTMILTASRSGLVAFLAIIGLIVMKSRNRAIMLIALILATLVVIPVLSIDQKDRYLSVVSSETKNATTATTRLVGIEKSFQVAMRRPLFGHGMGTSYEANVNYADLHHRAHNLYAEVAQELGFIGLFLFLLYIGAIIRELKKQHNIWKNQKANHSEFIQASRDGLRVFLYMNLLFSLASFGLSGYEWYLMPALLIVLSRLSPSEGELSRMRPRASHATREVAVN